MTVRELLIGALQDLNAISSGDSPSPDDIAIAFARLNDFVDDLKNESLTVYTRARTTWTLTANVASYTVGVGGTIAIPRPLNPQSILNIGYQDTSITPPFERLVGPCLTEDDYAAIPFKTLTDTYPTAFYYNATASLGILWVFPIPTSGTLQGVIYAPTPVAEFADLNDTVVLVPGFRRFFRNQLVCELASAFEKPVPPNARQAAVESLAKIKRTNIRLAEIGFDAALVDTDRAGNVYTG